MVVPLLMIERRLVYDGGKRVIPVIARWNEFIGICIVCLLVLRFFSLFLKIATGISMGLCKSGITFAPVNP